MKKALVVTPITVTITIGIFLLVTFITNQTIFAETYMDLATDDERAINLYFSIKPLDTWIYEEYSKTAMAKWLGSGPANAIDLWPSELDLSDTNKTSLRAELTQNEYYTLKNAPLSNYVNFIIENNLDLGFSPDLNTTIDGEPAVRLTAIMPDIPKWKEQQEVGWKQHVYLALHNNNAFFFSFFGDPKSFDKYLPEFEQMIRSIKWVE